MKPCDSVNVTTAVDVKPNTRGHRNFYSNSALGYNLIYFRIAEGKLQKV